jgi:transcriptional regulator with XRE-family HTH domain
MFGDRLEQALKARKRSRKWLADKLGVTESAITMVLNGQAKSMNAANCTRTAHHLDVSALWLATGDGEMTDEGNQVWRDVARNLATALDAAERGQRFALFVREVDTLVERAQIERAAQSTAGPVAAH